MNSTLHPPTGLWKPQALKKLHYGPGCVQQHLLSLLPTPSSKAYIITGNSLATKTPLIKDLESLLTPAHHAGTFASIKQHAPVADLTRAAELVHADPAIDTLISVGGGSPIDSAKWISLRVRDLRQKDSPTGNDDDGYLAHIAIPTTLSAAECTAFAGFTDESGAKTALGGHPLLGPTAILYDSTFAQHTPKRLWLATGLRALDHAVEMMYHPSATEAPGKAMAMHAARELAVNLRRSHASHPDDAEVTINLFLAAFTSLEFLGGNMTTGLGLSHSLGYALGSAYGIPHGETSCMTLGRVVKLKAKGREEDAEQIARLLPCFGGDGAGMDNRQKADKVGDLIMELVRDLELVFSPADYGVGRDQVEVITKRALGIKMVGTPPKVPEDLYQSVRELVSALFDEGAKL